MFASNVLLERYAVFGNPIQHSRSPLIHSLFANQTKQKLEYTAQCVELGNFTQQVQMFFASLGKGCNVTIPFKEEAFSFANHITLRAKYARAVNTLKQLEDGSILGDNTDGTGLISDLGANGIKIKDKNILLIGAGGAVKGVIGSLIMQHPQQITITNRTFSKALQLAQYCSVNIKDQQIHTNAKIIAIAPKNVSIGYDLIINASATSLIGILPQISPVIFSTGGISYDLVYLDHQTIFNKWALSNGASYAYDGLGMLVYQAAESFFIWRGVYPDPDSVLNILRSVK